MPKLVISGTAHEVTEEFITIGRAPDNMIVLNDPSVSSRHAEMRSSGDTYRLKDLGSTNGTRINGIPIAETALRPNDRIRFGGIDARYESDIRGSQPLPQMEQIEAKPAESSAAPVGFANASPFPRRSEQKDPIRMAILAGAAIALLAFFASMIAVLFMHAPTL